MEAGIATTSNQKVTVNAGLMEAVALPAFVNQIGNIKKMKTPWIRLPSPSTGPPRPSTGRRHSRSPVPKPRAHRRDLAARRRSGRSCHMCPLLSHPKVVEWEQATVAARRRSTRRIRVLGGRGSPPWWRGGGVRIGSNLPGRATAGSQKVRGGAPAPL
jgi:hypothetical protein